MTGETATKWIKRLVALAVTVAAAGAFLGLPTDCVLRIQPAATWTFFIVLALGLVCGRLFCECFCPLGVLQSFVNWLFHPKSHVRRVCTRLPETLAQRIVRWTVVLVCVGLCAAGFGALGWALTPYSIFGKAMTRFLPGLIMLGVVLILSIFGKGRLWCNWICPIGTAFALVSRISALRHNIGPGCANCRACFRFDDEGDELDDGEDDDVDDDEEAGGLSRREAIRGVAALAASVAAEKTTDGGLAEVVLPGVPARPATILPPGAGSRLEFNLKCVACGRCISHCPTGVLRQSVRLSSFGQPEMFFQEGFCRMSCGYKCASACPVGALRPRSKANRKKLHFGLATVRADLCLRETEGVACKACLRKCPLNAITIEGDVPVVDPDVCVGCGACEHVCAARPEPAIRVEGLDRQWEFTRS